MIRDRITQLVTYLSRQIRVSVGGVVLGRETGAGSAQELTLDGLSITAGVLTVVGKQATLTNYSTISALTGYPSSFTPSSHNHVSASITDASSGGNGTADGGKLVKFGVVGSLKAYVSESNVSAISGTSVGGAGVTGLSTSSHGGRFGSEAGSYNALFGYDGASQSFVARSNGAFGWIRGAYTGGITAAGTLTDNRTYTLPDASGTVALTSDLSSKQDTLVSGTNIKTVNGASLLGSGDVEVGVTDASVAAAINGATEDTTPLDNDRIPMTETAAAGALRWLSFASLWGWIKAKIDLGQTWAGVHAFSSTTRPTSAGTGTPGATSLITEADMRERYVSDMTNVYVRQQMGWDAGPWVTVGASPSYLLDGNGIAGARLIGSTTQAAASAQGGGVKYPDGAVTGGSMAWLTRAFQMRFLFRNAGGQAAANAFFLSLRNNVDFWSNSSIGLYHVPQPANAWQAGTVYVSGDRVNVAGIVHVVSTGGTSGGSAPSWNTTRNGTTTDNTVTWRNLGPHTSGNWALGFVDASGVITLTDTGVAWVTGTTNTTLLSLRSDGASVFASVNGSAEVSVARGALFAATPYIMGRGDTNLTHRIHGLLFTFTTTPQ